jgi:hypothetical protein
MQVAIRPYATAGIALVGASVIAVSPIAPPLPDVHVPSPAQVARSVELAAEQVATTAVSYQQVFQEAVTNLQAILKTAAANPTPILSQVLANQLATVKALAAVLPTTNPLGAIAALPNAASTLLSRLAANEPEALQGLLTSIQTALGQISTAVTSAAPPLLQAALGDLTKGNVEDAINNVLSAAIGVVFPIQGTIQPLLAATVTTPLQAVVDAINSVGPLGTIISNPLQNVVNVINAVQDGGVVSPLSQVVTGLLGPAISGAGAFGAAVDNVGHAIVSGNLVAALGAIVNAPATVLDGVLNGGFGPNLAAIAGFPPDLVNVVAGGLLSGGLNIIAIDPKLTVQLAGTINSLQALVQSIAKALVPPAVTQAAKVSTLAAAAELPAAPAKTVTVDTGSSAAALPAKTDTPAQKPASTGATKDSSTTSTDTESSSTTKNSTAKPESTEAAGATKPSDSGAGVADGNKADPKPAAGAGSTKSGGETTDSTGAKDATTGKSDTAGVAGSADKGSAKTGTAKHGKHAK